MKNKIASVIIFSTIFLNAFAQQNSVGSGGEASGSGGSLSYSLGQVDYSTLTGSGGNANQGVQQPYVFTTRKGEMKNTDVSLTVFPNPATDAIVLNTSSSSGATRFELHDAIGKLILKKDILQLQTQIDMKSYSNGAYFLSVFKKEALLKEFKVVKSGE